MLSQGLDIKIIRSWLKGGSKARSEALLGTGLEIGLKAGLEAGRSLIGGGIDVWISDWISGQMRRWIRDRIIHVGWTRGLMRNITRG